MTFFFFKQKTAYEMRISDWSSDVCSSELDQEHRIAKRMLRGPHNSNDRLTETIDELMGIFFAMPDKVDGDHGRRTFQMIEETFEGEIGRASCRERVCQYV